MQQRAGNVNAVIRGRSTQTCFYRSYIIHSADFVYHGLTEICRLNYKLEVDEKPAEECLCPSTDARTYARTDRRTNQNHNASVATWAEA